jgi:Putative beta barrel porin-7 (BBP7)
MRPLAPAFALFLLAAVGRAQTPAGDPLAATGVSINPAHETEVAGTRFPADCCPPAPTCTPRWWVRGEYVFWTIGTGKLVEFGLDAINSDVFNGLLAATGKDYRDVAERLLGDDRTGYRLGIGGWLDDGQTVGVEADFLRVSRAPLTFDLGRNADLNPLERLIPNGDIVLQRAGLRPERGAQADPRLLEFLRRSRRDDRILRALFLLSRVGLPGVDERGREIVIPFGARDLVNGSAQFELADQTFWALDLLGRGRLVQSEGLTVDGLVGYRRVYYTDAVTIHTQATTLARPLLPGTVLRSADAVGTQNTYDGVLLGADVGWTSGNWALSVRATATPAHYQADVDRLAFKTITFPDRRRLAVSGGTYLRSSDLGEFSASGWTVISEVGLRATRTFGENIAVTFGTSLLYIPDAARALPQLPLGIDPDRALPGRSASPQVRALPPELRAVFLSTLTAGLEFRF